VSTSIAQQAYDQEPRHDVAERTEKLLSYAYTLQRTRKNTNSDSSTKPAKSLVAYLSHNPQVLPLSGIQEEVSELINACERAVIQALRAAGESGDYKLILSLLEASILYANDHPILTPRIFGEALEALGKTSSNVAKLKHVWNLVALNKAGQEGVAQFLQGPVTAYELNVMLKALASRGKMGACLELYRQHTTVSASGSSNTTTTAAAATTKGTPRRIHPDAYTAVTLFTILNDSIHAGQPATPPHSIILGGDMVAIHKKASFSSLQTSLGQLSSSACWQLTIAIDLMNSFGAGIGRDATTTFQWNNQVFGALLKLLEKAQEVFPGTHQNGPQLAITILESMMQEYHLVPDVVTCTLVMKAMGDPSSSADGQSWKMALRLLDEMKTDTTLPKPNVHSYAAAIMTCARHNAYPEALKLLDEMTQPYAVKDARVTSEPLAWHPPQPNTWVYNAALLAIAGRGKNGSDPVSTSYPSRKNRKDAISSETVAKKERRSTALDLLSQMDELALQGLETKPDTVTYNTVLGIVASNPPAKSEADASSDSGTTLSADDLVVDLLRQMKVRGIVRDAITYHNAILAMQERSEVIRMVDVAIDDGDGIQSSSLQASKLDGKAADGLTFVFNSALSVLAGDWKNFQTVFLRMQEVKIRMNSETTTHFINALGRGGLTSVVSPFLSALSGNAAGREAEEHVLAACGINLSESSMPLEAFHYSEAISVCLVANDFDEAHRILSLMRERQMNPTNTCLEKFSLAYARMAVKSASKKEPSVPDRKQHSEHHQQGVAAIRSRQSISKSRAFSAYSIAMALDNPPSRVLCTVAKACAVAGMWDEARSILHVVHQKILSKIAESVTVPHSEVVLVPGLHKALLRQVARQGNVTAALWYCDDIQHLSRKMRVVHEATTSSKPSDRKIDVGKGNEYFLSSLRDVSFPTNLPTPVIVGMKAEDWMSLLTAACKSGNWRVCLNTLQFLRPFLEKTHPALSSATGEDDLHLRRYEQLAPALTTVIRSLEQDSQYAWAIRAIDDWMEWSGRRPPLEAASAAIRLLSAQGLGEEVNSMLLRCILQGEAAASTMETEAEVARYEEMLCIRAIGALHHDGLYDDADEAFLSGVSQGYLFFPFEQQDDKVVLDLHGMNVALAHSAVRVAMRQQALVLDKAQADKNVASDMIIVTGRGWNSPLQMRPVLRPEVQRMLLEEFYPPLNTVSIPQNMGALVVVANDIAAWQAFQQERKGARMLELAAILKKNLSSVSLLRQSIAMAVAASPNHFGDDSIAT
jgi:hypothetical protein